MSTRVRRVRFVEHPLVERPFVERSSAYSIGLRWMAVTLAAGAITAVLGQIVCGPYAIGIVPPIFCLVSAIVQARVITGYASHLVQATCSEWALINILVGWLGLLLGVLVGAVLDRLLLQGDPGNSGAFIAWGATTGLVLGLVQALFFAGKLRPTLTSHVRAPARKGWFAWPLVTAASWAVGIALNVSLLRVAQRMSDEISFSDNVVTPTIFAIQFTSLLVFSVPISVATGVTLAWLLRQSGRGASHNSNFIPHKVN